MGSDSWSVKSQNQANLAHGRIKKSKSIKSKCEKMNDWETNCNMTMVHQIYPTLLLGNKLLHFRIVENIQDVIAFTGESARAHLGNFPYVFLILNIISIKYMRTRSWIPSGLLHLMGASFGGRWLMRWAKSRNRFNNANFRQVKKKNQEIGLEK